MNKYKVGDKVRCISDEKEIIKPGTVLTIEVEHHNKTFWFEECQSALKIHEIEPLSRTIRDVKIGEERAELFNMIYSMGVNEKKVNFNSNVEMTEEIEKRFKKAVFEWLNEKIMEEAHPDKIKQPEQEKQEIEIAVSLEDRPLREFQIRENRTLIIELQKLVNKIVKE